MLNNEIQRRLTSVERLLPQLQQLLTTMQHQDLQIRTKSTVRDLVTKADVTSDKIIVDFLQTQFPEDSILAEESGNHTVNSNSDFTWCIDPIDGTVNYAHGIPLYSVSFGIIHNQQPVGGLVFIPQLNDTYRAQLNGGATKNGQPIHVSNHDTLQSSMIVTGFPYQRMEMIDQLTETIRTMLKSARGIRRTGSAALDLCWLAEGRFDGHYEWHLSPWDTCGGIAILNEAGGKATNQNGDEYRLGDTLMIASNGHIHNELSQTLLSVKYDNSR
ncbi:MAG: inositol monophosphatase [Leptonema sp. (in: Bacteria)]|nr:inositol monophosphatase [Leptonema sp. (in: bacteria)]